MPGVKESFDKCVAKIGVLGFEWYTPWDAFSDGWSACEDAAQQVAEADAAARDDAVKMFMASKDVLAVVIHEEHSVIAEVFIVGGHYDDAQMDRLLEIEKLHHERHPETWIGFHFLPSGGAA